MAQNFMSRAELAKENEQLKRRVAELEAAVSRGDTTQSSSRLSNQTYRNYFEQAGDSILIVEPETLRILEANPNAARRLGYSTGELCELRLTDIEEGRPEATKESMPFAWESTLSGLFVYETHHRKKSGERMLVEVSSSVVYVEGRPFIQNVVRDLTKRKMIEMHKREIFLERERTKLLSNFIEKASHHFRTPLTIILTSSYLMTKSESADKREEWAETLNSQVATLTQLVDGMITLSTLTGKPDLRVELFDVAPLLEQTVNEVRNQLESNDIELQVDREQAPAVIRGSKDYLVIALKELLANAIQSVDGVGLVLVRQRIGVHDLTIEVHDNGSGIPDEHLARIFETFYRVDAAGTTTGLGLGLSIVKLIVEKLHGRIEVGSGVEGGMTFRIRLPLASS